MPDSLPCVNTGTLRVCIVLKPESPCSPNTNYDPTSPAGISRRKIIRFMQLEVRRFKAAKAVQALTVLGGRASQTSTRLTAPQRDLPVTDACRLQHPMFEAEPPEPWLGAVSHVANARPSLRRGFRVKVCPREEQRRHLRSINRRFTG